MRKASSPLYIIFAGVIVVLSPAVIAQTQQVAPPAPLPTAQAGANLFPASGCTQCHGPEGKGTSKAPSIHEVRKRKTDAEIYTQIKEGKGAMPPFGEALSEDEIRSIVSFLRAENGWKLLPPAK